MAQPSVASFFNTRKRAASEDTVNLKNKRLLEVDSAHIIPIQEIGDVPSGNKNNATSDMRTRSGRVIKRSRIQSNVKESVVVPRKMARIEEDPKQKKLVEFIKKGPISPCKSSSSMEMRRANEETPKVNSIRTELTSEGSVVNAAEIGLKTPTKQIMKGVTPLKHGELKSLVKKELKFDEVKTKLTRSAKLQELKASLSRIQELEKTRKAQEERNSRLRQGLPISPAKKPGAVQLKEFDTIELEILTSPAKTFKTPTKLPPPTPDKNELMSPRRTDVSKRVLFSPAKNGAPAQIVAPPAYQRFMSLAETSKAGQLPLPFKYRHLMEIFKGLDSVCAMFHNRKECITFKKLKPTVQRMLRKNFSETHLAQIKYLYPEAFSFTQMKMRNYGSTSKADYFQLVITPNVEQYNNEKQKLSKIDEDDVLTSAQTNSMNPQVMTERLQRFHHLLLQRVQAEHDKFLKSLEPPLSIPKDKVTRWHPDFDLENCPEIERGHLPQPPNVEKYSSARDILSTARNLFNCATPMERAMERYEAKMEAQRKDLPQIGNITKAEVATNSNGGSGNSSSGIADTRRETTTTPITTTPATNDITSTLLKGVPQALLEKIRAKQAAKALDAMTRRPSQDQEAAMYSRLPELARHLRNVFITERKGVLTLEIVIKKIENSFRTSLSSQEIDSHLRLMAKEVPNWVTFHEVRKTMYLKIAKDMELAKVIEKLEAVANEKSK